MKNETGGLLVIFLFALFVGDAACLAASSQHRQSISAVISTKRDGGHSKSFSFDGDSSLKDTERRKQVNFSSLLRNVQSGLRSTFLPSGYPSRTPKGYLSYSVWSWVQDLSTQLRAVLATQRVLEGVGVGREGATALSAILNFIVRDGCGMAATLLFTSVAASQFRTDVKRWRLFADIMVDVGITLEVAAAQVPQAFFLPMICVGNMCKAVCGVAAGACGGAINLHWAQGSDISDISAKFGAQHTVTGSLGLVFAALFARSVSKVDVLHLWLLYGALTALHIVANMRCMRLIAFTSFNTVRLNRCIASFLDTMEASVPTPEQVARKEPLFFVSGSRRRLASHVPIRFGVSFNEFSRVSRKSRDELKDLLSLDLPCWIAAGEDRRGRPCVVAALHENASPFDQTRAYFHAVLLGRQLQKNRHGATKMDAEKARAAELAAASELDDMWIAFATKCREAGWDLTTTELRTKGYEIAIQY